MSVVDLNAHKVTPLVFGIDEHWKPFDKAPELLELVNPINYEFKTDPKTTLVQCRPISCYKDGEILKVSDITWTEEWAVFYFLHYDGNYVQLGSISENIEQINQTAPLNLQRNTIFDYLKLVGYFYVVDDQGSRFPIEGAESEFIDFISYSNQLEKKRNLQKLTPPKVTGPNKDGDFQIECDVIVGPTLFRATFDVKKNGDIYIVSSSVLVE